MDTTQTKHDLIKALLIAEKYNPNFEMFCSHDVMCICEVDVDEVSGADKELLHGYGFHIGGSSGEEGFESFRWGSC